MEKSTEKHIKIKTNRLLAVTALIVCVTAFCSHVYGTETAEAASDLARDKGVSTYAGANGDELPRVIAHGGGTALGYKTTNSLEAVQQSIEAGYTLIELDMLITADDEIVMAHDFGSSWTRQYMGVKFKERPTAEEYLSNKIYGFLTPMSFDMLTDVLDEHPDVRIVTDCKENAVELLSLIARKYPHYIANIVPQIYDYYQYEQVKRLGYEDIIFTLYTMNYMDYDRLLAFIKEKELLAVTGGVDYTYKEVAYRLAEDDVCVYMHPLNDFDDANALIEKGIYGVYSSVIAPDELCGDERTFYLTDPVTGEKLSDVTLPGMAAAHIMSIPVHGAGSGGVLYYIDGFSLSQKLLDNMTEGIHTLTIKKPRGQTGIEYLIYIGIKQDGSKYLRVAEQKNAYRLKMLRSYPDMAKKLSAYAGLSSDQKTVLMNSVVMAAGESGYYDAGVLKEFRLSKDELTAPKFDSSGAVSPPVNTWTARPHINYENVLIYLPEGISAAENESIAFGKAVIYIFNDWDRAKEEIYATCI